MIRLEKTRDTRLVEKIIENNKIVLKDVEGNIIIGKIY